MRSRGIFLLLLAAVGAWSLTISRPALAVGPVGNEFQANTYYTGNQLQPAVAATRDGRFVVVWQSRNQDGDSYGIFGQRYDAHGLPRGPEFAINQYTTGNQGLTSVAMADNGSFVVTWESGSGQDGDGYGIFGRLYDPHGTPAGPEFRVNTYTTGWQTEPSVASDGTGFLVVWRGERNVFAQRYDAAAQPVGGEFQVDTYGVTDKFGMHASFAADGSFVVAWASNNQGGDIREVFARRFDSAANPLTGEIAVNTYTTGSQTGPRVASTLDGHFVVAWSSYGEDGSGYSAIARMFDAAGNPQTTELGVNSYTTGVQRVSGVAMSEYGNFVVTWDSDGADGSNYAVVAERYDAGASANGPNFIVNNSTGGTQKYSSVAPAANGRLVAAWTSDQDADFTQGIVGKRFGAPDLIFQDGFESGNMTAWSSAGTGGGDLTVTGGSAQAGTSFGLHALVNDTASLFVEDDTPAAETHYRARFYVDPSAFDPGEASGHFRVRLLLAQDLQNHRLITIVLKRQGGNYSVMARVRLNDGSRADTPFVPITAAPHAIELDWDRAGSDETADGTFELFVDGTSVATLTGLDDGASAVEYVRLGVISVKSGASGVVSLDQFVSHRRQYIGP